ncbi:hypothetical protein [Nostoc sp.]|uniref:hypothetical protein n=1 Tax=Nostoc sp. TaxID=1180 RepID=UPI002FF422D4
MALVRNHRVNNKNNKDAINRRLYNQSFVETAIYRVFLTKSHCFCLCAYCAIAFLSGNHNKQIYHSK